MEDFGIIEDLKNDSAPPFAFDEKNNFPNNINKENNEFITNNKNIINENDGQINDDYLYIKIPLNKINKNQTLLKLDIEQMYINELEKESLIDLINFINELCELRLNDKFTYFKHITFKIERKFQNEYLFQIKTRKIRKLKQKIEKKQKEEKTKEEKILNQKKEEKNQIKESNIINEIKSSNNIINAKNNIKNNLINEPQKSNNNKDSNKKENICFCSSHNKAFKSHKSYLDHCKDTHIFKCEKCEKYFSSEKKFKNHICNLNEKSKINENIIFKNNNSKDDQQNKNKVKDDIEMAKCSPFYLLFNNIDLKEDNSKEGKKKKKSLEGKRNIRKNLKFLKN